MPEVVPPAPEDVVPPAEVVPPPDDEDEPLLRVEREAAGLRVDVERERDAVEREAVEREDDEVERDREAAGLEAEDEDEDFDAAERDDAGLAAEDLAAVEREDVEREDDFVAVLFAAAGREEDEPRDVVALREELERRAAGLRAVAAGADVVRPPTSSAETRLARPSTSVRRPLISSRTRSSSTSRMRFAATAMSPDSFSAAPAVPAKVRSTAARTASTASAAPAAALSFLPDFFESFLAMAARS